MKEGKWKNFWSSYRNGRASKEEDLFFQVGKTINGKPITREVFQKMISNIASNLKLAENDNLLEFCCGNGLITYELKDLVKGIVAVDFAAHLIEEANRLKADDKIKYYEGDVINFARTIADTQGFSINKFLMNDSLGYFSPADLDNLLELTGKISKGNFTFYITGVPNDELKWNFYNTEERKKKYFELVRSGDETFDGMGRWWKPNEIELICNARDLRLNIDNQDPVISNYRMNLKIEGGI